MKIPPFETEQFFSHYEFSAPHLLACSDCETMSIEELLDLAGMSLDDLGKLRLGYTESPGNPELRAAIAATHEHVTPDDVVVLGTPIEGIYLAMRTLLEPGDEVIALCPSYDSLRTMAEQVTGKLRTWNLVPGEKRWELDLSQLESLITPATRLVIVNFPHNPTGYLPLREKLDELIGILEDRDVWLFCDEMYRGTEFGDRPLLPSAADLYEKSLVLSGLSKTHGLPGLRSGWLVIRDGALREELINWKHYTSICPPAPSEFLATAALKVRDELASRNRDLIARNIALAEAFFTRRGDFFTWRKPDAGSVALVGVDVPSATDYCHALAREAGVVLLPGPCLGSDDRHVRFGFGRTSFPEALERYEEFLERS